MANECDKSVAQVSSESSVKEEIQAVPKTSRILDNAKTDSETEGNDEKSVDAKSQDKDGTPMNINFVSDICISYQRI